MWTHWIVPIVASCFIAVALCSSAREQKGPVNTNAFLHGTTTCLQGDKGPGVQLLLEFWKNSSAPAIPQNRDPNREPEPPKARKLWWAL